MRIVLRWCSVAVLGLTGLACEDGAKQPTSPAAIPVSVSVSGTVVAQDGTPVPGASYWIRGLDPVNRFTDAAGGFAGTYGRLAAGQFQVWMAAGRVPEFGDVVYREISLGLLAPRDNVVVQVIRNAPPFSMSFYEQFVRNARDGSGNQATRPWTVDPSFHIRTTHVETGEPIPAFVLDDLENLLRRSVPLLSGGRRRVAGITRGADTGQKSHGWVNVLFQSVLPAPGAGGQATVGGNSGTMWLRYDPANPRLPPGNGSACASVLGAADHEIVHTMGFYHVNPVPGVDRPFQSLDFCTGEQRPDIVRYHADIMYSRPPGNLPPDRDPPSTVYSRISGPSGPGPVVTCAADWQP